jgi:hypothetical protein
LHSPIVTVTQQLIRDELALLRRLAVDRRAASTHLPRVRRSALLHDASGRPGLRAAPAAKDERGGEAAGEAA